MRSYEISRLLLLLFLIQWDQANGLCHLVKYSTAQCLDLEDARYIDTYQLSILRAHSFSKTLTPGHFQNLTSLRHLDLSGGKIEKIKSGSFAKLSSLQTLNLAENHIRHLDTGAFDGLKHLHSLKLGSNAIRQLPSALMSLKELRLLDISGNPLDCNCASMKLRDVLLLRGVTITKKTQCSSPPSVKYASIMKPDTKMICLLEKQDEEMQADQPVESSTEVSGEADDALEEIEKDFAYDEVEITQPTNNEDEEETAAPSVYTDESSPSSMITEEAIETMSNEAVSTTAPTTKENIVSENVENSSEQKNGNTESSTDITKNSDDSQNKYDSDDLIIPVTEEKKTTDSTSVAPAVKPKGIMDDLIYASEGSGDNDDDGSGLEGSGIIAEMPGIDFNETSEGFEEEDATSPSSTSTTTTTESSSWWGFGDIINNLNPWGSYETTEIPSTTERSAEDALREEEFIAVKSTPATVKVNEPIQETVSLPKVHIPNERKQSPRTYEMPDDGNNNSLNGNIDENSVDPAFSKESKKGMGSYVVLATLLAILAALIGFAAYKGDFCRKKRKRRDVERGTELKDMRKSLLDQNTAPPKVQASNGNTMENVPLMTSTTTPEEPKDNQRSYDITPAVTNGSTRLNGPTIEVNDPVKPPRKSTYQEIEAPLNGLNPPMEAIDAPITTSLHNGSNEVINNGDCVERPPLSPGAQRVKITLQENPDSVPKTPILITRLKGGENLVKAP